MQTSSVGRPGKRDYEPSGLFVLSVIIIVHVELHPAAGIYWAPVRFAVCNWRLHVATHLFEEENEVVMKLDSLCVCYA